MALIDSATRVEVRGQLPGQVEDVLRLLQQLLLV
jgi:hypothetical protein